MNDHQVAAQPPMTPLMFHILLALGDKDLHGYGILREIARNVRGSAKLPSGQLFVAAVYLLSKGLIEETTRRSDPQLDDKIRCYYRLTPLGRLKVGAESERMADMVGVSR